MVSRDESRFYYRIMAVCVAVLSVGLFLSALLDCCDLMFSVDSVDKAFFQVVDGLLVGVFASALLAYLLVSRTIRLERAKGVFRYADSLHALSLACEGVNLKSARGELPVCVAACVRDGRGIQIRGGSASRLHELRFECMKHLVELERLESSLSDSAAVELDALADMRRELVGGAEVDTAAELARFRDLLVDYGRKSADAAARANEAIEAIQRKAELIGDISAEVRRCAADMEGAGFPLFRRRRFRRKDLVDDRC